MTYHRGLVTSAVHAFWERSTYYPGTLAATCNAQVRHQQVQPFGSGAVVDIHMQCATTGDLELQALVCTRLRVEILCDNKLTRRSRVDECYEHSATKPWRNHDETIWVLSTERRNHQIL